LIHLFWVNTDQALNYLSFSNTILSHCSLTIWCIAPRRLYLIFTSNDELFISNILLSACTYHICTILHVKPIRLLSGVSELRLKAEVDLHFYMFLIDCKFSLQIKYWHLRINETLTTKLCVTNNGMNYVIFKINNLPFSKLLIDVKLNRYLLLHQKLLHVTSMLFSYIIYILPPHHFEVPPHSFPT
jgi:hypothetical protein